MRNKMLLAALGFATSALLVGAGAATGASHSSSAGRVVISTKKIPKLGTILVDGQGRTLYMFVPDKRKKVTCVHTCAVVWPPVKLFKGARTIVKGTARRSLLGSDPNPAGARVVTYNRWPLYRYVADTAPGQAKGQALNLNGGLWYVLSPSGSVIRKKL
jgi:predicted lipoprotein with Yx(FWY)xxD motif